MPASDKRIKILRVIARLNMGGPALHVAYLTEGLRKRGYDTTLVAGSLARGEDSMAFVADARGVEVVRIDELGREISPLRDLMATIRLARLIRKERPQILHTHTAKAGTVGRVAARLAGSRRPPIVVHTFHGHVLRGYFGPVRTLLFRLLERWLAAGTTALVAVSPQVRDDLVALGVAPRERFVVIRLGIELDERVAPEQNGRAESRRYLGIPGDRFAVGWIGRMTAVKRTDDVLIAFKGLRDSGVDAVLCMVGDGPDRVQLEQRAHELGVARDTVFLGYQEDVAPFYAAFDALVLPSGNEGTPVTVIEALAAERPVVATRVGGVPDVVRDGEDGFLVEAGATDDLADRLGRLARDPALRARMGRRAASACCRAMRSSGSSTTSTSSTGRCSVRQAGEDAEGRLLLPGCGQEAGLPSDREIRVVAEHEPEHQVDARVLASDRERLAQIARLLRPRDAEEAVGGIRLPAVLGDPDALLAPELVHGGDERVDVSELHRSAAGTRRGRLARPAVVRVVRLGVEVPQAVGMHGGEKHERRDRRAHLGGVVVATRRRHSAGDTIAADACRVDTRVDRLADLRVVDRALDHPLASHVLVLRLEEDRVVRLVPGRPELHGREPGADSSPSTCRCTASQR